MIYRIYRVVIIDNGHQVSLTFTKQGRVSSMDFEGDADAVTRFIMEQAIDKLKEVEGLDGD